MTAALWSFHPAFKISASPLIIILSFAIIFMSIVVIVVVYGKFDTELKRVRSGRGTVYFFQTVERVQLPEPPARRLGQVHSPLRLGER